jgi:hypothetical protein
MPRASVHDDPVFIQLHEPVVAAHDENVFRQLGMRGENVCAAL